MLVSGVLHELGHLIQAIKYNIRVFQAGFCLYYVFPGFYITIDTIGLKKASKPKQFMVFVAGMLMNLKIAASAQLLLQSLPSFLSAMYTSGSGEVLILTSLHDFPKGYVIKKINGHDITKGLESYKEYLLDELPISRCMLDLELNDHKVHSSQCCNSNILTKSHIAGMGCIWDYLSVQAYHGISNDYKFVPSKCSFKNFTEFLAIPEKCTETKCTQGKSCMSIPSLEKSKYVLLHLEHYYVKDKREVLFIGNPTMLFQKLQVGLFIPRYDYIPISIPFWIEINLLYFYAVNVGNVMLNILPIKGLDGDLMADILIGPSIYLKPCIVLALIFLYYKFTAGYLYL